MPLDTLSPPVVSALTAAAILLLQMILMLNVGRVRQATETVFGDGDESLQRAIRTHANLIENAGSMLVGLALLELIAAPTAVVAGIGGLFVVSRIAHAVGLGRSTGVSAGRFVGAVGTLLTGLALTGALFWFGLPLL